MADNGRRKIILDCDPGHDDAVALMMAARHPKLELLGVTTVRGNQTLEKTTRNALNLCQYLGVDVPVCEGMGTPLVRPPAVVAGDIHGATGLDGPVFEPLTRSKDSRHAVDFIIETLLAHGDDEITLVPTGPLTNIAMAMRREPRILPKIREIVLMGGAVGLGNITPAAEFNIHCDAEAAYVVFTCGRPVVMIGLDLTHQAQCTPEIIERMARIDNRASRLFCDLMRFFSQTNREQFGLAGGPLHDPNCIAYLIDPGCMELKSMYAEIEIRSESCYGRTSCDFYNRSDRAHNARVGVTLDAARFWDIVEECIRLYG
ncbi:nucleoside hydrolase [Clostridiales bacterium BX7]|uniref:Nucleoside hydrolase n=2 Tax=Feifania hominis TaxID=2763660 RepID=A0A926DBZ2_9FIRM|nr:nucleoside hydrolase [Feifania hominis]